VIALTAYSNKLRPFVERLDALTLRERVIIFGAGVALLYVFWHAMLIDPMTARAKIAEERLAEMHRQMTLIDQVGIAASQDPAIAAARTVHALQQRLAVLDAELATAAQGYVAPDRMTDMLRELLAQQHGLTLVSLANMPVESLSQASPAKPGAPIADDNRGPFLHPVEMVVQGDYASVVAYLRALEAMPWRIRWEQVELVAGDYPQNRVRIVIGALSLSRYWMTV
jgi:MSHA biogenesis protein MshJ